MNELSMSRMHVAITLDRLRAVDHKPIVGVWPSLLIVTSTASLQLDLPCGLSVAGSAHISGRLLAEVARWHEAIRDRDSTTWMVSRNVTDPALKSLLDQAGPLE